MKAIIAAMERAARAVGLGDAPPPALASATMLNELEALWQPMVAVPRAIVIERGTFYAGDTREPGTERGDAPPCAISSPTAAAWCVIDLDGRVLSCESRGLWWDPFVIVQPNNWTPTSLATSSLPSSLSSSSSPPKERAVSRGDDDDTDRRDCDSDHRVLLQSVNRTHAASWWCEIVRGPHARDAERSVYHTNLTFSDVAIEPQRGVIMGARLHAKVQKNAAARGSHTPAHRLATAGKD
nr:hypothetical protein [Pandoravirus massiliensis]